MQAWSVLNRHWLRTAVGIFQISLAPIGSHAWSWAAENLRSDASFWKQSSWNFPASSTFRILLSKVSTLRQWCDVRVEKAILGCGFQSQFLFPSQTSSNIINHHQISSNITLCISLKQTIHPEKILHWNRKESGVWQVASQIRQKERVNSVSVAVQDRSAI